MKNSGIDRHARWYREEAWGEGSNRRSSFELNTATARSYHYRHSHLQNDGFLRYAKLCPIPFSLFFFENKLQDWLRWYTQNFHKYWPWNCECSPEKMETMLGSSELQWGICFTMFAIKVKAEKCFKFVYCLECCLSGLQIVPCDSSGAPSDSSYPDARLCLIK